MYYIYCAGIRMCQKNALENKLRLLEGRARVAYNTDGGRGGNLKSLGREPAAHSSLLVLSLWLRDLR